MKRFVSILVVSIVVSVFGFANYPVMDGTDLYSSSLGKTGGTSHANWIVNLKYGSTYYGTISDVNYKAIGTFTNTGVASIDDSSNYNTIFKTSTKVRLFVADSLYLITQSGSIFQIYVQRFGWRRLCSLSTSLTASNDFVRAIGTDLYLLVDNKLYKVPHIENSTALTAIVTDVSVSGFNYIGGKIWYTTTNSLVQCDLDGTNRITIKTGSHFTDIDAFAVSLLDTSIIYRYPNAKYELHFDRGGSSDQVCNIIGSVSDSLTNFRVDSNNDIWFSHFSSMSSGLFKYDVDDSIVTKYSPTNNHSLTNHSFRMSSGLDTVFVGEGDSVWIHTLNHKPRYQLVYNIDSVGFINEINQEVIYSCTLGVVDDNSSNFTYSKIGSTPSWINLNSGLGDSVIITADRATAIDTGSYEIKIMVQDDFASPMTDTFTTTLTVYSRQLSVSSVLDSSAIEDILYSLTINLNDFDSDSAYVYQQTIPSWVSFSRLSEKSFKLEGTPDEDKTDTLVNIIFTDSTSGNEPVLGEAFGFSYDTASFNLTVVEVNDAPVISTSAITSASEGVAYSYDVNATDVDDVTLTYGLTTNPTNMTISSSTGVIDWTPTYTDAGDHSVVLYVWDGTVNTTQSYTITVVNVSDNPVITSTAITVANENELYTYDVDATDINDPDESLTFFFPDILPYPDGMTIDGTTGIISWTPDHDDAGTYTIKVYVTDGTRNGTQTYDLIVADVNGVPAILTVLNDTTISETQNINYSISVTDIDDNTHAYSWKKDNQEVSTSSIYDFTTDYNSSGSYSIEIFVSDNDTTVSKSFTITVLDFNIVPTITTVFQDTTINELDSLVYSVTVIDVNDVSHNIIWKKDGQQDGSGSSYIFRTDYSSSGNYEIIVEVSDNDTTVSKSFTISVIDFNATPLIMTVFQDTIINELDSLVYSVTVTDANDASHNIIWKKDGTQDATGSSYIFRTNYSSSGSYYITIEVSDNDTTVSKSFTVTVTNVNRAPEISTTDTIVDIIEGDTLEITISSSDPDGDILSFSSTNFDSIGNSDSTFKIIPKHNSTDTIFLIISDQNLFDSCRVILNIQARVGIINSMEFPKVNSVCQNFPNPFNPITSIKYSVAKEDRVTLSIFDMQGRMVNRIVDKKQQVGHYTVVWDGLDRHGMTTYSGTYIYQIKIGEDFSKRMKMILLK